MTTLALGLAGAGLTSFTPLGPGAGFAIGTYLGGILDRDTITQPGPRLDDLRVTTSGYGQMLPIVYGQISVPGIIIDASEIREQQHTRTTGGGKGTPGPQVEQESWTYSVDLCVALCEGEAQLLKLYANEQLLVDTTAGSTVGRPSWLSMNVYPGNQTQTADPALEALHGAGNVPGYRGVCYVMLYDLPLAPFNNNPAINFRAVVASVSSVANSDTIVTDTMISSAGSLNLHPNTGAVFVGGNAETGIAGRAYNPFSREPLFSIQKGDGGGFDNSNEGGFFSVPEQIDGVTYFGGANRHYYFGNTLDHGLTIIDAYTGAYIAAVDLDGMSGSDNTAGVTIDERTGKFARTSGSVPSSRLRTYDIINTGPSFNLSTAASTIVPSLAAAGGGSNWRWRGEPSIPNGTDRAGVIAIVGSIQSPSTDYLLTVENSLIRASTTTGVSDFSAASGTRITWDSVHEYFWMIGEKSGDSSTTVFRSYTRDCVAVDDYELTLTFSSVDAETFDPQTASIYLVRINNGSLYRFDTTSGTLESWTGFTSVGSKNWSGLGWHPATQSAWTVHNVNDRIAIYEPDRVTPGIAYLDDVVSDVFGRCGIDVGDQEVSALSAIVEPGYRIGRRTTGREILKPPRLRHRFDLVDTGAKLKCVPRGQSSSFAITKVDLGFQPEGADTPIPAVSIGSEQPIELPKELIVRYLDAGAYYEPGAQRSIRQAGDTEQKQELDLPMVMTGDEALQLANVLLHGFHIERETYKIATHLGYLKIEGADVGTLTDDEGTYTTRVTSIEQVGAILEIEGTREYDVYTAPGSGVEGVEHTTAVIAQGPTLLFMLEIPLLRQRDNDPGLYVAGGSYVSTWPGAGIFRSSDAVNYSFIDGFGDQAVYGFSQDAGDTGPMNVWDEDLTLTIAMVNGVLTSCTTEQCLNEVNSAAWGTAGRWELVLFRDVVDNGDGTFEVTGFVRGMRSTGHNRANHQPGDLFIILTTETLLRIGLADTALIGTTQYYKAVTYGDTVDGSTGAEVAHTHEGAALVPWRPVNIEVTGFGGNITIDFYRQDRIKAAPFQQPPQSESSASYECDIIDNVSSPAGSVVRTLTSSTETFTYSTTDQTTDFGGTVSKGDIGVRVYQISSVVDRGQVGAVDT